MAYVATLKGYRSLGLLTMSSVTTLIATLKGYRSLGLLTMNSATTLIAYVATLKDFVAATAQMDANPRNTVAALFRAGTPVQQGDARCSNPNLLVYCISLTPMGSRILLLITRTRTLEPF
jgi:hypothetical protein